MKYFSFEILTSLMRFNSNNGSKRDEKIEYKINTSLIKDELRTRERDF